MTTSLVYILQYLNRKADIVPVFLRRSVIHIFQYTAKTMKVLSVLTRNSIATTYFDSEMTSLAELF